MEKRKRAEKREDMIRLNCNGEITGTNSKDKIREEQSREERSGVGERRKATACKENIQYDY